MAARVVLLLALAVFAADGIPDSAYNEYLPYDRDGPSSKGTDFIVAFLPNLPPTFGSKPLLQLLVTTDEPDPVTFTVSLNENLPAEMREGFPLTTTVSYGEVKKITMHEDMAPTSTSSGSNRIERSKAIHIRTEGGKKVSVQGFNDNVRTTDGFVAFPCDAMRNSVFNRFEYMALSAGQRVGGEGIQKRSLFVIVPCDDQTVVRIEPTQRLTLSGLFDLPGRPSAVQVEPGSFATFTANSGQTILITHSDDLSGTIIRGRNPLAIFSGHECADVPTDVTACDHLVEQMPLGMAYGRTFFFVPLAARAAGDLFRVGTLTDGTKITVTCVTSAGDVPKILEPMEEDSLIDRGETLTFRTPSNTANVASYKQSYCCLDATKPVVVAQYSIGYSADASLVGKPATEVGDPFMTIIPPVNQYINNYTVTSLEGAAGPFPYRYINLAIAAQFFDNTANSRQQIMVNGTVASPIDGYIPFYCSNNEICGYGAQVEVNRGTINIYHERPDYGLLVSYYAYQQQNSYGLPLGFEFTPFSATRVELVDITVRENVGTITISVQRVGDLGILSLGTLTHQSTDPEEARVGEDYLDFGPIALRYRGREDMFTFDVTILNDTIAEPIERFQIFGVGTRNLLFLDPIMTVTILDDDGAPTPSVFFDPTSYTVNENDGTATLTVRTDVSGGPQSGAVQFYTESGSATAPGDYTSIPVSGAIPVNFGPGETSTTVTVSIQNDNLVEPDETFFGRLRSTGTGDVSITQDRAEVTILNDDVESVTVSMSPLTYEVVESEEVVNVVVIKAGNFLTPIQGTLTTSTGSASVLDYDHRTYQFVIQPEQQKNIIPISIIDDVLLEDLREQFSVIISLLPQSGLILGNSQGSVTIVDNEVEIRFNPVQYQVNEETRLVTFEVENRNPDRVGQYSVQFTTIDGSAVQSTNGVGGDYVRTTQDLTFSQGEQLKTVDVTIINDNVFENLENFSARITTFDRRVIITEPNAVVQVVDDDIEVDISISPREYEVDESAGVVRVTVQKSGMFSFAISGSLTTTPGTADGATDFTSGTYTYTILPNQQETTVSIPITNDQTVEQLREQFSISLSVQPQPGLNLGNSEASVTIVDDDGIIITLEPSTQTVSEGSDATFRIVATGQSVLPYSVQFSTVDGTARAPGDYRTATLTLTRQQLLGNGFEVTIPVEDDSVLEAQERFQGQLQLTQQSLDLGVVSLGQRNGEVTIVDNDMVDIGFAPSIYSVEEGPDSVVFFIQNRNPDMERNVVIEFMTVERTAIDGNDYVGTTQSITFQPGQTLQTVQVMIIDDSVYEGLQDFLAELTTTDSGVNIFQSDATAQITDEDEISVQFNPTAYTVTEGGSAQLVIQKVGAAEESVTVSLSTQEGTAINTDFTRLINTLVTFGPGEIERRISIQTNPDSLVEGTENFTAELVPVSDRVRITEGTARILIQETTNVVVEFQPTSYVVNEDDGVVSFTIVKRTPTTQDITVQISTTDGSATSPSDYSPLIDEEVTFTPSETVKIVMILIKDDNVFEGEESFTASLSPVPGSTGVEIGQQGTATTIIMDGPLIISFSSPEYTTPEDGGLVEVCLSASSVLSSNLTVVLLAEQNLPIDALDGQDFTGGEYRVQFPAGVREHCTEIPIIDDSIALEGDEAFVVKLDMSQLPDGVRPGSTNISSVIITDNDEVRVFFEDDSYQVPENNGSVSVCVRREGDAAERFSIEVATAEQTPVQAQAGSDYRQVTTTLTFEPEDDRICFEVPVLTDQLDEGKEDFVAEITAVPDGIVVFQPGVTTISILDVNVVTVEFSSPDYSVPENEDTVTVCLITNIGNDQPITVVVSTSPNSATAGVDYNRSAQMVTIPPSPGPSEICFEIDIINDNVVENEEEFLVSFQIPGSDAEIGTVGFTRIRIIDDDEVNVFFASSSYSVSEADGRVTVCVRRDGAVTQPFSIQVATSNLSPVDADDGSDYRRVTTTLTFQPNEDQECFDIPILADQLNEGTESFSAEITSVPSRVVISSPERTIISIVDDDVVTVDFGSPTYTVPEDGGSVQVCLRTNVGSDGPLTLTISTAPKSATPGLDYDSRSQQVTIPASTGPSETCFNVGIIDDSNVESDEEFLVSFLIPPGSNAQPGAVSSTCITITDNDEVVTVDFGSPTYTVPEDGGSVQVCLRTNVGIDGPLTLTISTAPKSATPGLDYNSRSQQVTIPASTGPSETCFNVGIIDDSNVESDEEFLVSFLIPPGSNAQPGAVSSTCITITDNDEVVTVDFGSPTYTVPEDGGSVQVCLRTNVGIDGPLTLTISTAPKSATPGLDYDSRSQQVTIPASTGPSETCFNVGIVDDSNVESDEEFLVSFLIPPGSNAQPGAVSSTCITITDNDEAPVVEFVETEYRVAENEGNVEVCLRIDGRISSPVVVRLIASPETAEADLDYSPGILNLVTFQPPGNSVVCTRFEIIDDPLALEGEEKFVIDVSPRLGQVRIGRKNRTVITIEDNDVVPVVQFVETEYRVTEGVGDVDVCLRIDGRISNPVVVRLFPSPDTAEAGLDYIPGILNLVSFQPPGDSVVCTRFEIIDDLIALEGEENFVIDVRPRQGLVQIGIKNRTVVTIEDNDVVNFQPSTENAIVSESEGRLQVCLMKDADTARPVQIDIIVRETIPSDNSATAGSDFMASTSTVTFGERDRQSCTVVEIINDDVSNEVPEVFQVNFLLDEPGTNIVNPISMVTIIDDDVDTVVANDTVIADPLYTAPLLGGGQLCYEIHGRPNITLNLVSDKCTSVNAHYDSMNIVENGNIIRAIGIRAADSDGNCHNIEIRLTPPGVSSPLAVFVDGAAVSGAAQVDAVRVRRYSNRVRVTVPNCDLIDLVMWVFHTEMSGQDMLKFVITRGYNLAPTSHGLIGQFWNIPVTVAKYDGPLRPEYERLFDRDILYLITVTPSTGSGELRNFLGELHSVSWDRKPGPCYYVGGAQGGRTSERDENDSVIEGQYTDYQVNGLFGDDFLYSQFEEDRCDEAV